jgi:hypothetical protein
MTGMLWPMPRRILVVVLAWSCAGCFLFNRQQQMQPASAQAQQGASLQDNLQSQYEEARSGDPQKVLHFTAYLTGVLSNPDSMKAHGDVQWDELTQSALDMLDGVIAEAADAQAKLQGAASKAMLLIATKRSNEAVAPIRTLHDEAPSYETATALLWVHAQAKVPMDDPEAFCRQHRPLAQTDVQVHDLMQLCAEVHPASTVAEALAWAPPADHETYLAVERRVQAEAEARYQQQQQQQQRRGAEEEARRAEMAQSSPSSASSSAAPAPSPSGPQTVSVTLKNSCPQTVKLFFGDKPKFGSGTYSSIGSNTSTSRSMREGDMIWIVDDGQNGISSISVSPATGRIEILDSCSGFTTR